jgi:hypothetical protein
MRRVLGLSLAFFACSIAASAQTWSLTNEQRRAYLNYYAPIILKRADENNSKQGRDWTTNFDFDQDGNFSNNRVNWLNVPQIRQPVCKWPQRLRSLAHPADALHRTRRVHGRRLELCEFR